MCFEGAHLCASDNAFWAFCIAQKLYHLIYDANTIHYLFMYVLLSVVIMFMYYYYFKVKPAPHGS